jgi:predicted transposase YbfD/YdcC
VKIQKLIEQEERIKDPGRQYGYLQHKLVTIVIIAFCAIVCGAEDEDVRLYFENIETEQKIVTREKDHGRIEKREYFLETDINWLSQKSNWVGLSAIGAVKSTVFEKEQTRTETRYFVTSLTNIEKFADSVRKHWSIEGQLHRHLDVTFGEDRARMHKDNSPLNWNIMRKTALPLLRNADVGRKTSVKRKMFMAALDVSVLEKIIFRK